MYIPDGKKFKKVRIKGDFKSIEMENNIQQHQFIKFQLPHFQQRQEIVQQTSVQPIIQPQTLFQPFIYSTQQKQSSKKYTNMGALQYAQ